MRALVHILLSLLLIGCSSLRSTPKRLVVERAWARSTLKSEYLGGRRQHRFAPILTENLILAANSIDGLVAYERSSGQMRWRMDIADGIEGGATLSEGKLYFGAGDGLFYAVNPLNGNILWTYPLKAEGLSRPTIKNGVVYVLGGNNVAHALDAKTGKLLWLYNRREASNLSVRGGSQPALSGDLVLIGFSDGALVALKKSSGSVMWETNLSRNKRFRDVDASPVVDGETAFVSSYDGALYAVTVADGKILWTVEDGGYDEVLLSKDKLFYSSTSGKIMAVDKVSGKTLWSRTNPDGISTAPSLIKNVLVVGEMDGALRFLDANSGQELSTFDPGRGVTSKTTYDADQNRVFFMSADANLYALAVNWKQFTKDWPWE